MGHSLAPASSVAMDASRKATLDLFSFGLELGLLSLPPTIFGVAEPLLVAPLHNVLVVEELGPLREFGSRHGFADGLDPDELAFVRAAGSGSGFSAPSCQSTGSAIPETTRRWASSTGKEATSPDW